MTKRFYRFGKKYRGYEGYPKDWALAARIAKIYKLPVWLIKEDNK